MLTYATDWYLTALTKAYYIYPPTVLFHKIDYDLPYNSWAVYQIGFIEIIPQVVEEHHLLPIIDYVKKHRCFEDFQENRESKYKTHSAVIKRIKRIGEIFQKYAKTDLGFD